MNLWTPGTFLPISIWKSNELAGPETPLFSDRCKVSTFCNVYEEGFQPGNAALLLTTGRNPKIYWGFTLFKQCKTKQIELNFVMNMPGHGFGARFVEF